MSVDFTIPDEGAFNDAMLALEGRVTRNTGPATRAGAEAILEAIRRNMFGPLPPKPAGSNPAFRTGNLFDSVRMETLPGAVGIGRWNYEIYVDVDQAPYARRIEGGFHGTDSLGRNYNQPPYPFFEPGVTEAVDAGVIENIYYGAWSEAF